jgi:hypothetical protein
MAIVAAFIGMALVIIAAGIVLAKLFIYAFGLQVGQVQAEPLKPCC